MISRYRKYRLLEMIPGSITWITLISMVVLTFVYPLSMVYFIVAFDFYWMVKVVYMSTFLIVSYKKYRRTMEVDWQMKNQDRPGFEELYQLILLPYSNESREVLEGTIRGLTESTFPKERMLVVIAAEERFPSSVENGKYASRLKLKL